MRSNLLHASVDEFMQEGMWITLLGREAWVIYLKETREAWKWIMIETKAQAK